MSCKTCLFSRSFLHWLLPFKGPACQLWLDWLCSVTTIKVFRVLICYLSIAFFIWLLQYLKWFYNSMSEAKGRLQWVEYFLMEQSYITHRLTRYSRVRDISIKSFSIKVQLNSEWIYEVIVSPKMQTKNYKNFCPTKQTRIMALFSVDILVSVGSFFWLWSLFVW